MSNVVKDDIFLRQPGMGLNANPFEAEMYIDLTSPMGSLSSLYYGLMFQLGKVGFTSLKIDEAIEVTPAFKQYYDLTIQQRQALEQQIKAGLGSLSTAIHDYELIWHDLRKYKEYLDYFTKIEQGRKQKKSKKKEEKDRGEQMEKEGVQLLRSVFIDQVDAHTGEGIALRTITQRWPTIIVDFMRLDDKDMDQKKIAERYNFTEAEGAVLATKNKLFIEWRDSLFRPTLQERYQHITRLVQARKASIQRYTEMLKPVIARFKLINDWLEQPAGRAFEWRSFFQPASQAYSQDITRIWSFMPFAPAEKYKVTRDYLDEIPAKNAGFGKDEIEMIKSKREGWDGNVWALPVEPSIDKIVRDHMSEVQKYYQVKIDINDVFEARKRLEDLFRTKSTQMVGGSTTRAGAGALALGASWMFSPYFIFLDIPFNRFVYRSPTGNEFEDLMIQNLTVTNRTQNVVIVSLLEVVAREKQLENYISQLVGEMGGEGIDMKTIEELVKGEFPDFFGVEKKGQKKGIGLTTPFKKVGNIFGDIMHGFGPVERFITEKLGLRFDWLRARGPYEFAMDDRIAEMFQVETMVQGYLYLLRYLQRGVGVPGVRV